MNRRNFFTVLPLGLAGFATVAKAQEPKVDSTDVVATQILILRHDDKIYNVLAVPQESTQFAKLGNIKQLQCSFN